MGAARHATFARAHVSDWRQTLVKVLIRGFRVFLPRMQSDSAAHSMLRVVQIPPIQPLELSPGKHPFAPQGPPGATCVLLPVQHSQTLDGSPLRLQTLGEPLTLNNNNNNVTNNNNNIPVDKQIIPTKVYAKIQPVTPEMARCKRKISVQGERSAYAGSARSGVSARKASSVARRNERERNRVKQVNQGFERLRQHVPNGAKNKKMSKVETLRSALEYIKYMQELLEATEDPVSRQKDSTPAGDSNGFPMQSDQQLNQDLHLGSAGDAENFSPSHSFDSSLPSPNDFSADDCSASDKSNVNFQQHHPGPDEGDVPPLSPEQNDLLDLATLWLMQS